MADTEKQDLEARSSRVRFVLLSIMTVALLSLCICVVAFERDTFMPYNKYNNVVVVDYDDDDAKADGSTFDGTPNVIRVDFKSVEADSEAVWNAVLRNIASSRSLPNGNAADSNDVSASTNEGYQVLYDAPSSFKKAQEQQFGVLLQTFMKQQKEELDVKDTVDVMFVMSRPVQDGVDLPESIRFAETFVGKKPDPALIQTNVFPYDGLNALLRGNPAGQSESSFPDLQQHMEDINRMLASVQRDQLASQGQEQLLVEQQEQVAGDQQEQLGRQREEQLGRQLVEQLVVEQQEQLAAEQREQLAAEQQEQLAAEQQEQYAAEHQEQLAGQRQEQIVSEEQSKPTSDDLQVEISEDQDMIDEEQSREEQISLIERTLEQRVAQDAGIVDPAPMVSIGVREPLKVLPVIQIRYEEINNATLKALEDAEKLEEGASLVSVEDQTEGSGTSLSNETNEKSELNDSSIFDDSVSSESKEQAEAILEGRVEQLLIIPAVQTEVKTESTTGHSEVNVSEVRTEQILIIPAVQTEVKTESTTGQTDVNVAKMMPAIHAEVKADSTGHSEVNVKVTNVAPIPVPPVNNHSFFDVLIKGIAEKARSIIKG